LPNTASGGGRRDWRRHSAAGEGRQAKLPCDVERSGAAAGGFQTGLQQSAGLPSVDGDSTPWRTQSSYRRTLGCSRDPGVGHQGPNAPAGWVTKARSGFRGRRRGLSGDDFTENLRRAIASLPDVFSIERIRPDVPGSFFQGTSGHFPEREEPSISFPSLAPDTAREQQPVYRRGPPLRYFKPVHARAPVDGASSAARRASGSALWPTAHG